MKRFKDMVLTEDKVSDMAQGYLNKKEEWKPEGTAGRFAKGAIYGGPSGQETLTGQIVATTWEILDPTGISSYDDAAEALITYRKHPNPVTFFMLFLNIFNCVPNLALFAAAGAAMTGVGAPVAAGGAAVGAGWAGARGSVKYMIAKGAKHPEKLAEFSEKIMKLVSRTPGGPEAVKKVAKDLGGTPEEIAAIEKAVGSDTGVKLVGEPKPKPMSPDEYRKLSPEEKEKVHSAFKKTTDDTIIGLSKKIKEDPRFISLINRQKHYRSEEMVKAAAENGITLTGKEADYGIPKTLDWIVQSPTDPDVISVLGVIAKENRVSVDDVIESIRKAYPDLDLPKVPKVKDDAVEVAVKTPDEAIKTAEKASEAPVISAPAKVEPSSSKGAKSPHKTREVPYEKRVTRAIDYAKMKAAGETTEATATNVGKGLGSLLLGLLFAKWKTKSRIATNIINDPTAWVMDALDKAIFQAKEQTAKREQYLKNNSTLYPGVPSPSGGTAIPSDADKDEKPEG